MSGNAALQAASPEAVRRIHATATPIGERLLVELTRLPGDLVVPVALSVLASVAGTVLLCLPEESRAIARADMADILTEVIAEGLPDLEARR